MADNVKNKKKDKETASKSVKTREFTLKKPLNGKAIGDKVKLGEKGEQFYKRNNTI